MQKYIKSSIINIRKRHARHTNSTNITVYSQTSYEASFSLNIVRVNLYSQFRITRPGSRETTILEVKTKLPYW